MVVGYSGRNKVLETEAAIAVVADAVVNAICADFGGMALWALLCGCCLQPLLASIGDLGEGCLIVVEECFDDVHCSIFLFGWVEPGGSNSRRKWLGNFVAVTEESLHQFKSNRFMPITNVVVMNHFDLERK